MALATLASILDLLVFDDEDLGGLVVILLGGFDTDRRTIPTALRTKPLGCRQFVTFLFASQLPRRRPATMRLALTASSGRGRFRRKRGRCRSLRSRQTIIVRKQRGLLGSDGFRTRAIDPAHQRIQTLLDRLPIV